MKYSGFLSPKENFLPPVDRIKQLLKHDDRLRRFSPVESKTLILAINYDQGVLIGADKRTVNDGYGLMSDNTKKLAEVSPFSIIGSSGIASLCETYAEWMQKAVGIFLEKYGKFLSPDGQVNYLKNLIEAITDEIDPVIYAEPILVAYDEKLNRGRIFFIAPNSSLCAYFEEKKNYYGIGCGFTSIWGLLETQCSKPKRALKDALKIAIMGFAVAGKTSIGVTDIRIALPDLVIIDSGGIRKITDQELKPLVKSIRKIIQS